MKKKKKILLGLATAAFIPVMITGCSCNDDKNKEPETVETQKTTATITNLAITGKTYDGTAITAPTYDKNSTGTATVEYKLKSAADTAYTTTAPKDAGEYTVRVTLAATDTHTSVVATKDFTIAPIVINDISKQFTYDMGAYYYLNIDEYILDCDEELGIGFEFKFENENVGAELVAVKAIQDDEAYNTNYVAGNNVTASIVPAELKNVTVTKVYDGTTTISDYRVNWKFGKYVLLSGQFNSANVSEANSISNIVLSGEGSGNFTLSASDVTATITKAEVNIGDINVDSKTYDGNPINDPMYVVDTFVAAVDKVVEYKAKDANDDTYTTTAPSAAGEYTVRVTVRDSSNYNGDVKTANFTIGKTEAGITDVTMSSNNIVYGDSYEVQVNTENFDGTPVIEYKVKGADDNTYDSIKPVNAGEYTARVTLPAGANNTGDVETIDFEIKKKVLDDLYEVVIQNGESEFTFDLSDIEAGLSAKVTFEDDSAGADVTNVQLLGDPASNYEVDLEECYFAILSNVIITGQNINVLPGEYTINFVAGTYVIDVTNKGTGSASGEVYSKLDQSTPVFEFDLNKTVKFPIPEIAAGEYIVKITGSTSGYITINEHNEHGSIDDYGFCTICGEYIGVDLGSPTGYEEVEFTEAGKKFLRFDINNNYYYGLKTSTESSDVNFDVKVYRMDNNENLHVVELTETPTNDFVSSFDDHFYIVVESDGAGLIEILLDEQDLT